MIASLVTALVLASPPSHVMDQADVIPPGTESLLEQKLVAFENQHKVEVVVATFDSLMGRPETTAAGEVARSWAIGSRTSKRAVLISYWKNDRATRIDVTDALPQFSSARASQIVDQSMIPKFKQGRTADGLEAGADAVIQYLSANPWSSTPVVRTLQPPPPGSGRYGDGTLNKILGGGGSIALVIVFVVIRVALGGGVGFGGGRGYRRGWGSGYRSSSWGSSSRSSWGGGSRSSGGGGFSGRGASGRW